MITISNELPASLFISNTTIHVTPSVSFPVQFKSYTSAEIRLVIYKPGKTPNPRKTDSITVAVIPKDSEINGWRLKSLLLVHIRRARRESIATTWLEGVAEYGTAKEDNEAIIDLVISLGEYRESLEKIEKNLGDSARKELAYLRRLIERVS